MNPTSQIPVKHRSAEPRSFGGVLGSLQREIDRLFEDFIPTPGRQGAADVRCSMDLAETKDGLELTVELPGMDEKDVQVSVSDGLLTVSGEKRFETEEKDKNYHFVERGYGSFSRSVELPPGAKPEEVKATLSKGVLKVTVPTSPKPEAKKIEVHATS